MTKLKIALLLASLLSLGTAVAHAETKTETMADDTFANDGSTETSGMKLAAVCKDGKSAYKADPSKHQGLCRGHGGVDHFANGDKPKTREKKTEYK
jgi:hypothetical protein